MLANLDETLNSSFCSNMVPGGPIGPQGIVPRNAQTICPAAIPSRKDSYYSAAYPYQDVSLFSAPAVIPTAAVGVNPYDAIYGPLGDNNYVINAPSPAYSGPPQIGRESFA